MVFSPLLQLLLGSFSTATSPQSAQAQVQGSFELFGAFYMNISGNNVKIMKLLNTC